MLSRIERKRKVLNFVLDLRAKRIKQIYNHSPQADIQSSWTLSEFKCRQVIVFLFVAVILGG